MFYKTKNRNLNQQRGRNAGIASWLPTGGNRLNQQLRARLPDANTVRKRALYDARGKFAGSHTFINPDGSTSRWTYYRSAHGRTDQYDLFIDSRPHATIGAKALGLLIADRLRGCISYEP